MLHEHENESFRNSDAWYLLPIIRDGVFHCTTLDGIQGIIRDEYIIPNHGQFTATYPQTLGSYGYSRGWISLFDFGSASDEECITQHRNWTQFFVFRSKNKDRIALQLNREQLADMIIPNSSRPYLGDVNYRSAIPCLECWYPEPIPVSCISHCLIAIPSTDNSEPNIIRCLTDDLGRVLLKLI